MASQISAIAPFSLAGRRTVELQVEYNGRLSNRISLTVVPSSLGIFTLDASGKGAGAILNEDGRLNSASNAAQAGAIIVLYATGAGRSIPESVDGRITTAIGQLAEPISLNIGGIGAEVLYAGPAPGIVGGVIQINARVPLGVGKGMQLIELASAGSSSQASVYVFVTSD
jgi:uncharacterized protein (TIGR03437 family)